MKLTWEQWAKVGITLQFLALVRTLAEFYRLRYVHGPRFSLAVAEPYVGGALVAAVLCWLAVGLFFFRRYTGALAVSAASVVVLFAYKLIAVG